MVKSRRVVSYLSRIPITRLYPRRTFFRRSFQKFLVLYGERFGLVGSIPVSSTQTGNRVLRLNYRSALGVKGFEFEIPEDTAMYSHVRKAGSWETLSSHFLAEGLKEIEKIGFKKSALVDLGANVGLVTLQTQNYAQTRNSIIMVEPLPNHITAIESNTNHPHKSNEV